MFKVNNPLYRTLDYFNSTKPSSHVPKSSLINMITVNGYETPNKPLFIGRGASPPQNSQTLNKPPFFVQGGYAFFTPNKLVIIVQGDYPNKGPYEYAKQIT